MPTYMVFNPPSGNNWTRFSITSGTSAAQAVSNLCATQVLNGTYIAVDTVSLYTLQVSAYVIPTYTVGSYVGS